MKKFYVTHPPKSGNSDSTYNLEIFNNQKMKLKKDSLNFQIIKTYIRKPQIKNVK